MFILYLILCIRTVFPHELGAGVQIPQAAELDELLLKYMRNNQISHGSASDFLLGINANESDSSADLDVNVLDMPTLRKIIHTAKKKTMEANHRRYSYHNERYILTNPEKNVQKKCFDLMKSSLYAARYRLQDTVKFRNKYHSDESYNIGLYISTIQQLLNKMESLFGTMDYLRWKTHFLWRLIIYEKILACNVDITYAVQRIFVLHRSWTNKMDAEVDEEQSTGSPPPKAG